MRPLNESTPSRIDDSAVLLEFNRTCSGLPLSEYPSNFRPFRAKDVSSTEKQADLLVLNNDC